MTFDQDPRWRAIGTWISLLFCLTFWILLVTGFAQVTPIPNGPAQWQADLTT